MKPTEAIDVETVKETAVVVRHQQEVGQALTAAEITKRLQFIKQVMQENMSEGVDYGKVPGCGDKPGLFQPGAQKLSMTFQLNPEVRVEQITDYPNFHRGYRLTIRVTNGSKFADGVGECSTMESKYRYRAGGRKCPVCGQAHIIKGKAEYGGGWLCFAKKGGCGAKFADGSEHGQTIAAQSDAKVENENPADHWNTARKMAFKRGFVHAIINATNTSELWSQDLEDLHNNGVERDDNSSAGASGPSRQPTKQAQARTVQSAPPTVKNQSPMATGEQKDKLIQSLTDDPGENPAKEYAIAAGILLMTEGLADWPPQYVPATEKQFKLLMAAIEDFFDGRDAVKPFAPNEIAPAKAKMDGWRAFPVPLGFNAI